MNWVPASAGMTAERRTPMSKLALGVDMGGTGIKLGLVDSHGKLLKTLRFSTPTKSDPDQVVGLIAEHVQTMLELIGHRTIVGIGIGCAGDIDPEAGVVRISPNLHWKQVALKALLARKLKYPIHVENDANAAAWAAYVVEARRKIPNLICITVGTGIGGGLVVNGRLYRGMTGSAGEIGHMTLFPEGTPCSCGNQGCLERYVGARAMAAEARRAIASGEKTLIRKMVGDDLSQITPLIVEQAARQKDRLALELWEQAGERLGITLASVINMLNPQWIVLAGGLSRAGRLLVDPLRRTISKRSFPTPAQAVTIVISKLDQDLGIVGAGLLAHEKFC
jgi:glucokinase